jgi:arabinan endo-1,5-alpha-L-arabinosidase
MNDAEKLKKASGMAQAIKQRKKILRALLIAGMASYGAVAQVYVNPLQGNINVHDPSSVVKEGATYHVFYTGNLIPHKTSPDGKTWTEAGSAISTPGWFKTYVPNNNGTDVWAPDISFRNGKYWLYYAVSSFGSNTSAIGLATTTTLSPAQWTDQGMVIRSVGGNNYNCIDPNAFRDSDGSLWLVFGSFWSGIKLVQLDSLTGKPASSSPPITSLAARAGGSTAIEAPFIFKRGIYYYLFVSWDVCCQGVNSTYNIRFGRSTAIKGPYSDQNGAAMASGGGTLLWSGDTRWKGPGGQSLFTDHDTVFLDCHSYDANANGQSKLIIRPLYWTSNGWPTLKPTISAALRDERALAEKKGLNATYRVLGDRFAVPEGIGKAYEKCEIYSIQGKLLFSVPTRASIDLKEFHGNIRGVYLLRFSNAE